MSFSCENRIKYDLYDLCIKTEFHLMLLRKIFSSKFNVRLIYYDFQKEEK